MSLEEQYYEHDSMWEDGMLDDAVNSVRYQTTIDMIPNGVSSLLDVGCGNGIFGSKVLELNRIDRVVGLDRSDTALSYVKTEKIKGDIVDIPFKENEFDCVSSLEIIEHLPVGVFEKGLAELCRVSNKYIVLSVPYDEVLEKAHTKCPQCVSLFNKELHLRSFSEEYFKGLLIDYGFENVKFALEGPSSKFYGHDTYVSIFYPDQNRPKWDAPLCPICGYVDQTWGENLQANTNTKSQLRNKKSLLWGLRNIPKMIWPKTVSYYWIIGLFERKEEKSFQNIRRCNLSVS